MTRARSFVCTQWARIPNWVKEAAMIGVLLWCLVSNYLAGNPGWCAVFGALLGLHIEQSVSGRCIRSLSRTCDQWDRMYAELSEHSRQQHEALLEALEQLEPAARIVADAKRAKH
jgi:hypothetical protein